MLRWCSMMIGRVNYRRMFLTATIIIIILSSSKLNNTFVFTLL